MGTSQPNSTSYPPWLPTGFQVPPTETHQACPSAGHILGHFALYNGISILVLLATRNQLVQRVLFRRKRRIALKPWTFWSGLAHLASQLAGIVLSSVLVAGATVTTNQVGQLIQLWALRPRTTWIVGNLAQVRRSWGYMNAAMSSVFAEVLVCGLACVFLVRIVGSAVGNPLTDGADLVTWYRVMLASAIVMLASTALEILWAVYAAVQMLRLRGSAEADDLDSLKWVARTFVPVTCICSWLVWSAFLYSAGPGYYCPSRGNWVDVVWGVVPVVSNLVQVGIEEMVA